jgi:hypothetical protein
LSVLRSGETINMWSAGRAVCERTGIMKNPIDPAELNTAIEKVHRAGMPGVFAEVRDGDHVWRGAAGCR